MTRFKKLKNKIEQEKPSKSVTFDEIKKYLEHYNYHLDRITGSHHIFKNNRGESITLPVHNKRVKYVYIRKIKKEIKKENWYGSRNKT